MKCPICDKEIVGEAYGSEHGVEEEYARCTQNGHYYDYQFTYGHSETTIGSIVIHDHYTDSSRERAFKSGIMNKAIEYERSLLGVDK